LSTEGDPSAAFLGQVRDIYARVAYSQKTHEKEADRLLSNRRRLKWTEIVLSALASCGTFAVVLGAKWGAIPAALASVVLLAIKLHSKDYDLGALAQRHANAAVDLLEVREKAISVLTDLCGNREVQMEHRTARDQLLGRLGEIYRAAPRTTTVGYRRAQKALKVNEELFFTSDEIDALLPPHLRQGRS